MNGANPGHGHHAHHVQDDQGNHGMTPPVPTLLPAPAGNPKTMIPKTPFAGPYESEFTIRPPPLGTEVMKTLAHVNCSYVSTTGKPPTLTQLKQHAQSLTVLIKHLTVSTKEGVIDNMNIDLGDRQEAAKFHQGESYDWLNDLTKEYMNSDHHHNLQLTSVLNRIEDWGEDADMDMDSDYRYRTICPLQHAETNLPMDGKSLPYASHKSLIEHANNILELLDHEFSAKGGLLSILPTKDQKEDRMEAEATLLGQLILYMQRLVQRLHDLERLYANAMDVLAGEAVVPHQTLSSLGPKGRQSREVVFPQDRFVLANAGEDVWQYLQSEFDRKVIKGIKLDDANVAMGVTGEAIWSKQESREIAQGIVTLDVMTRYYRLRNDPLKTIFVVPAHETHPGVKVTRQMECEPTVVSVVKPVWPERQSMWEQRNRANLQRLKELEREHAILRDAEETKGEEIKLMRRDRETKAAMITQLEQDMEMWKVRATSGPNEVKLKQVMKELTSAQQARDEAGKMRQKWQDEQTKLQKLVDEQKNKNMAAQMEIDRKMTEANKAKEAAEALKKKFTEDNMDVARASQETAEKLKAAWAKQMRETGALIEFLKSPIAQAALGKETLEEATVAVAAAKTQTVLDEHQAATGPPPMGHAAWGDATGRGGQGRGVDPSRVTGHSRYRPYGGFQ